MPAGVEPQLLRSSLSNSKSFLNSPESFKAAPKRRLLQRLGERRAGQGLRIGAQILHDQAEGDIVGDEAKQFVRAAQGGDTTEAQGGDESDSKESR